MENLSIYEQGLSGKMGGQVYFNRWGKTFIRKHPGSYNKNASEKQAPVRERFKAAHRFGQSVIADPDLKAIYLAKANGKCSAYVKAVSEFMKGNV